MAKKRTTPPGEERGDSQIERRSFVGTVELRDGDGDGSEISGYAAVTDQETIIDLGFFAFREKLAPGAFKDAIKSDDVRALFNHDPNIVLGRNKSGTLRLKEDDHGLRYDVDIPDTQAAQDVRTLIRRGDVSGSSFAFQVAEEDDDWDDSEVKKGKLPLRTIRKVSLYDVSPVTYPAYPSTSVSARSKLEAMAESVHAARAEQARLDKEAAIAAREAARQALDDARAWDSQ